MTYSSYFFSGFVMKSREATPNTTPMTPISVIVFLQPIAAISIMFKAVAPPPTRGVAVRIDLATD
jgi:hypothetical protein